jgi:type IV secretory pathway VirB2 component (pilin)
MRINILNRPLFRFAFLFVILCPLSVFAQLTQFTDPAKSIQATFTTLAPIIGVMFIILAGARMCFGAHRIEALVEAILGILLMTHAASLISTLFA